MSILGGLIIFPWVIKPVYGFISDSFPIMGMRRSPYLFIFGLFGALSWLSLAYVTFGNVVWSMFSLIAASLSLAFVNVLAGFSLFKFIAYFFCFHGYFFKFAINRIVYLILYGWSCLTNKHAIEALIVEKGGKVKSDVEGTKSKISKLMTVYWGVESVCSLSLSLSLSLSFIYLILIFNFVHIHF